MLFSKKRKYRMDPKMADNALQNIFAACETAPNTIPFNKLLLRQKSNTVVYDRLLLFTSVLLIGTFLLPFAAAPDSAVSVRKPHGTIAVTNDYVSEDHLYLTLFGDDILFAQAYLETADGAIHAPVSYDAATGNICFKYPETESNIYIPVENAATLHLLLSPY